MRGSTICKGRMPFAVIQILAGLDSPVAREIVREGLECLATKQQRNGTFGSPCAVERVAAVLCGVKALGLGP